MSPSFPLPVGPFVQQHSIGGGGGAGFAITEISQGKLVRTVGVHYNSSHLRGLRLTYTDGSGSRVIGKAQESYDELTFQPGETIVSASLWGNGWGTRTGRIRFTTSRQQILDVGGGEDEFSVDVGSGILVGFAGRHGVDIDALGFIFLLNSFEVAVTNVLYTQPPPDHSIHRILLMPEVIFRNEENTSPTT